MRFREVSMMAGGLPGPDVTWFYSNAYSAGSFNRHGGRGLTGAAELLS
jgi:hypothetical protein